MLVALRLSVLAALLGACSGPAEDPAAKDQELEQLRKRVTRLENRVRAIEGRLGKPGAPGKAPGKGKPGTPGPKPPAGPTRQIALVGDAKGVVLTGQQQRFKLPGPVPAGEYQVLVAFGEEPLARKGTLTVPKGEGPLTVSCTKAQNGCALKP